MAFNLEDILNQKVPTITYDGVTFKAYKHRTIDLLMQDESTYSYLANQIIKKEDVGKKLGDIAENNFESYREKTEKDYEFLAATIKKNATEGQEKISKEWLMAMPGQARDFISVAIRLGTLPEITDEGNITLNEGQ